MRVLYVNEYQGAAVVAQRHHRRNRALGAARKVELFAAALVAGGHQVHIVSTGAVSEGSARWYRGFTTAEPACAGVPVTYLAGLDVPRINLLYAGSRLRQYLETVQDVDLVLLYNLEWFCLKPVIDFCRRARVPLVIEYEDDTLQPIVGTRFPQWHVRRGKRSVDAVRSFGSGVAAVSQKLVDQLGIANAIVVPGAVDESLLALGAAGLKADEPVRLLYAGSLTRAKGVHELVEAVSKLDGKVVLEIVGSGPEYERLRSVIASRSLPVLLHGEVSRERLSALYAAAHMAINPHVMTADMLGGIFPFKIVEYVGAGLPVVTTELPVPPSALARALVTAQSGSPADLAEAIFEARAHYTSLTRGVQEARSWIASELSGSALARKLDGLLQSAAEQGKNRW